MLELNLKLQALLPAPATFLLSGTRAILSVWLTLACLFPLHSAAVELPSNESGILGYFDTTVSVGAAIRTQGRKDNLIAVSNGGSAWSINDG